VASLARIEPRPQQRAALALLVSAAAAGAGTALAFATSGIAATLDRHLGWSLAFLISTIVLQLCGVRLAGEGTISLSAIGIIASAIAFGAGPAMGVAVVAATTQWLRTRGPLHRAVFDASNFALSAGAASLTYHGIAATQTSGTLRLVAAVAAGLVYTSVNHGLLCLAIGLSNARAPHTVWLERFHWARYQFLAYGALALLAAAGNGKPGVLTLLAFVVPPFLLWRTLQNGWTHHSSGRSDSPHPRSGGSC
jgi:hypothetical protein